MHAKSIPRSALWLALAISSAIAEEVIPIEYDEASSTVLFSRGKTFRIQDDSMAYVIDWSADYSRGPGVGRVIQGDFFAFIGHLNHSRSILYIYSFSDGALTVVKNIEIAALSEKYGWAAIQGLPLYSSANDESEKTALLINGVEIGSIKRGSISALKWSDDGLEVKLAVPAANPTGK
jgi:hypothetical protein